MFWSIVCNEPWARWNRADAAAARGTYLAERTAADAALAGVVCSAMPKAAQPAWSRARVRSDVPVLLVVGSDDPQIRSDVRNARRELAASRTVVVPHAGHGACSSAAPRGSRSIRRAGTADGLDSGASRGTRRPPLSS